MSNDTIGSGISWWSSLWARENGTSGWVWRGLRKKASVPEPEELAAYRRIAMQLHFDLPRPDGERSVLLATPRHSSLCARGSASLALCMADEIHQPILLVDASLRSPDLSRASNCNGSMGLSDYLGDPSLAFEGLSEPTTHPNLCLLPAGRRSVEQSAARPDRMGALLQAAQKEYDFVLIAGGSVLDDATALGIASNVGCVLLLAVEGETLVEDLDAACEALSRCKARKVGMVMTTPVRG